MNATKCKIIIIGESDVGKTSLINFFKKETSDSIKPTVGCEYTSKSLNINGTEINLCIWDTAGQETYRSIVTQFFRNVHGVMLVFDITNLRTFEQIAYWLNSFKEKSEYEADFILIGNKVDLESHRAVTTERAQQYGFSNNMEYFETSATNGLNVESSFIYLAEKIVKRFQKGDFSVHEQKLEENETDPKCC